MANEFQNFVGLIVSLTDQPKLLAQNEPILNKLVASNPEFYFVSSVNVMKSNMEEKYKSMAVILLRQRCSFSKNVMEKLSPQTLEAFKQELIVLLQAEQEKTLLKAYTELVATIASTIFSLKGSWNEIIQLMKGFAQSQNENHRVYSSMFFSIIIKSIDANLIIDVMCSFLRDSSMKARLYALDSLIHFSDDDIFRQNFQPLLPNILEIITNTLDNDEDMAQLAISKINDIITDFIVPHLDNFSSVMFKILDNEDYEQETKFAACEFLVTVCEALSPIVRQNVAFINTFTTHLLKMLADVEDNPKWDLGEEHECDDEEHKFARTLIDRVSNGLRGKIFAPILFNFIPNCMKDANWKFRQAGLYAISFCAEGCKTFLSEHLEKVLEFTLPALKDPHPRVRWTACNCLGQLCTDFAPKLQYTYTQQILLPVIATMDDANGRVQAHAVAVIVNFCEFISDSLLTPYLNPLLQKMSELLSRSHLLVIENTLIAISSVAETVKEHFAPYYSLFMNTLQPIMKQAQTDEFRKIGGLVFETMSSIAMAVGRDLFLPDAPGLCQAMFLVKSSITKTDDPRIASINTSFVNLVFVLKDQFVPYFQQLLPELLQSVTLNPAAQSLNEDTLEYEEDDELSGNTELLKEKLNACINLATYIDQMGAAFYPWVDSILPICKDCICFATSGDIRVAGATMAVSLLQAVNCYLTESNPPKDDLSPLSSVFHYVFPFIYDSIKEETEPEYLATFIMAINELLTIANIAITDNIVVDTKDIITISLKFFREENYDYEQSCEDINNNPEDREKLDNDMEHSIKVLTNITDVIGKLLEYRADLFLPTIPQIISFYEIFKSENESRTKCRLSALCLYADVVKHGKGKGKELCGNWLPWVIKCCSDSSLDVVRCAIFSLGISAESFGDDFIPFVPQTLSFLIFTINKIDRSNQKNLLEAKVAENCIGTIGKLIQYFPSHIDLKASLLFWFSTLPISHDEMECITVYSQLCRFIIMYSEVLFGENLSNLPNILAIFGDIIGASYISLEIAQSMKEILLRIQSQIPNEILQSIFSKLDENQTRKLRTFMSS